MSERYFKKNNGTIIKVGPQHDLVSLKERFKECDINGNDLKPKSKPKPKSSKKKDEVKDGK